VGIGIKAAINFLIALTFYLILRSRARRRARSFLESPVTPYSMALLTRRSRRRTLRRLPPAQLPAARAIAAAHLEVVQEQAETPP